MKKQGHLGSQTALVQSSSVGELRRVALSALLHSSQVPSLTRPLPPSLSVLFHASRCNTKGLSAFALGLQTD